MNDALVNRIVNAVLYEGYILYPYRPGSRKNRSRFTLGRVYPEAYSASQLGAEPFTMQTECLLQARVDAPALEVTFRFLQPVAREVGLAPVLGDPNRFEPVPELRIDGTVHQSWQEAVEQEVKVRSDSLRALAENPMVVPFTYPAARTVTPLHDQSSRVAGVMARRQEALSGVVTVEAKSIDAHVFRITVVIANRTPVPPAELNNQEAVLMRTFASTHTILFVPSGGLLSSMDPPPAYADATGRCKNIGTWPVLIGSKGEDDTLLSSPIILYDYPEIAPQSPGDLCDGTEIDEILSLRIMTMTNEEKNEARHADAFARRILDRTDALSQGDLLKMHGVMREVSTFGNDFFTPTPRLERVAVADLTLKVGDRVRIRPKGRADVMDLALEGKIAVIEAIEQDAEDHIHVALVLDDDPGKDLGMMRQPGHRFFYTAQEVEPLREEH